MTACVNCSRALQPAWKYCIFCGTRTAVAATAPRSRPIPKRTPVPGYAAVSTVQTPIVPPAAPAPLSAAPSEEPVSSVWPETMGERPSLRSAIAATEVPAPTPPREDAPAPEDENEELPEPDGSSPSIADLAEEEPEPDAEPEAEPEPFTASEPDPEPDPEPEPEPEEPAQPEQFRPRKRRGGRGGRTSDVLVAEAPAELDDLIELDEEPEPELSDDPAAERRGSVNTLAILALFIGVLASPLAALFGHLALNQLKVSGERGVIPAWISVVLGYLWLGFWIVFGVTYFATNG